MIHTVFYFMIGYYYYCANFVPGFNILGQEFVATVFWGLMANLNNKK